MSQRCPGDIGEGAVAVVRSLAVRSVVSGLTKEAAYPPVDGAGGGCQVEQEPHLRRRRHDAGLPAQPDAVQVARGVGGGLAKMDGGVQQFATVLPGQSAQQIITFLVRGTVVEHPDPAHGRPRRVWGFVAVPEAHHAAGRVGGGAEVGCGIDGGKPVLDLALHGSITMLVRG